MGDYSFLIAIFFAFLTRKYFYGFFAVFFGKLLFNTSDKQFVKDFGWDVVKTYDYYTKHFEGIFSDALLVRILRGFLLAMFYWIILESF
jgi:hypothetical protein